MYIDNFTKAGTVRLRDRILLSPVTKYVILSLIVGCLLWTSVYIVLLLVVTEMYDAWPASCDIVPNYQIECVPGRNFDYETCSMIGCCWSDETSNCYHSAPSKHSYYYDTNSDANAQEDVIILRPRRKFNPMGKENWPLLYFHVTPIDSQYLQINLQSTKLQNKSNYITESYVNNIELDGFSVVIHSPAFSITVRRHRFNSTTIDLLTTSLGPLIVTKNYWEWTIHMTNITLYGLESTNINGTTHWLYNNEKGNKIPVFFGITSEGEAFAWYVLYPGPMEIKVQGDSNLIILKGMSLPEKISLRIFAGSTPQQTIMRLFKSLKDDNMIMKMISDVTSSIIISSLGLHVCPELEYTEGSIINTIKATIENSTKAQVPWDSHCIHRRLYSTLDATLNNSEIKFLNECRKIFDDAGKHIVPHLTPMILAKNHILLSKLENSSLILKNLLATYFGSYGEKSVVYPEWSDNRVYDVFQNYISNYINIFSVSKLIFIRDAWPRDDTDVIISDFSRFDYIPKELQRLMSKGTVPFDLTSMVTTSHYTTHNTYANKFYFFLQMNANPFSLREVFYNKASDDEVDMIGWSALRAAINEGIGSGLVGQLPPVIYVCGISRNVTNELCTRWYGAAVVFPHVMIIPEYLPGGPWITTGSSKMANKLLKLRSSLITYQYTIMEEYYNFGQPVLAPVHFHYPLEPFINQTNSIEQFFWGRSLLIGLVTLPNIKQLHMQIPGNLSWRHLVGGAEVSPTSGIQTTSISATEGEIVMLVRPGHIIPVHERVFETSKETTQSGIELFVNFACYKQNINCFGQGEIAYGSEIFLNIIVNETVVTLKNILNARSRACVTPTPQATLIKYLTILGDISRYRLLLNINLCNINSDIYEKII